MLTRERPAAQVQQVAEAVSFAQALAAGGFDVAVTEYRLGWSDGLAVFEAIRARCPQVPVVVLTAERDPEAVVACMRAGVADYIFKSSKGYLALAPAVTEARDRKRIELLAARSAPWLETVLDRSNIGVFRTTLDERLIESTPAVLRLLGVSSAQEALAMDLPAPHFRAEKRDALLERISTAGELQSSEIPIRRPDGTVAWLSLTEVLLLDVEGEIVVDVLIQEVSHFKDREAALERRVAELERSNRGLAEFASVAAHELQAPLRAVQKYAALLGEQEAKLSREGKEAVEFLTGGAARLGTLVEDLLVYSRLAADGLAFEPCDLGKLVDQALRTLRTATDEAGARVRRGELPALAGDPLQLSLLFQNLISNAIKFRRREESPSIEISARRRAGEWEFAVRDNGIGIERGETERVFQMFRRLRPEIPGSGIGLAIGRRIVERHGGKIWVESEPGKGSTFYFTLPESQTADGNGAGAEQRPAARVPDK